MLCDYDKSKRAQMERDTRNKQELEYYTKLNASIKEAKEEGIAIGEEKGRKEGEEKGIAIAKAEAIRNLAKRGMKNKEISEILNYELSYVEEVLKK